LRTGLKALQKFDGDARSVVWRQLQSLVEHFSYLGRRTVMNRISRSGARRFRRQHALLTACIPVAFLGMALPSVLPSPPTEWLQFIPAAWFFTFLVIGLFGVWLTERQVLRVIDPDPELRHRVLSQTWFKPFGRFWAVDELLRAAVKD
jgi:hypothetical protein